MIDRLSNQGPFSRGKRTFLYRLIVTKRRCTILATIREQKEQVVSEIKNLIDESKSMIIVKYQGINTEDDTELRKTLRENNVKYKVLKNTMVELAMKDKNADALMEYLKGPNAYAFGVDETTPAKLLKKFIADKKKLEIIGGYVDGQVYNPEQVKALAELPSKEELIGKLLGSLKSPVANLVHVLNALSPATKFTYLVKAIADKKAEAGEA